MWVFYLALPIAILAIIGAIAGAGIFSLILIPLAVIAGLTALWAFGSARATGARPTRRRGGGAAVPTANDLPHRFGNGSGRVPNNPESLVDARAEQQ